MKNKLLLIPFVFIIVSLFYSLQVVAYFPDTHAYIINTVCDRMEGKQTPVSRVSCSNIREVIAGNLASDISVVFYFTEFQKYEVTHSPLFCKRMIEEAKNERQLAFAYGSCMHHPSDSSSHNNLIPYAILHTFQPNYFIHPIAEESVNDKIVTKSLTTQTREALDIFKEDCEDINNCNNEFIAQLERVLKSDNTYRGTLGNQAGFEQVDIKRLVGLFIAQVQGDTGYSLGYSSIFAVPKILIVFIILAFIVSLILLIVILKKQEQKNVITKYIALPILAVSCILSFLAIIGLFTGTAFQMYKFITAPITVITPLGNWQSYVEIGVRESIVFFNRGDTFTILDPTGIENIRQAEKPILWFWRIGIFIFSLYILWLLYSIFFRKKKGKKK